MMVFGGKNNQAILFKFALAIAGMAHFSVVAQLASPRLLQTPLPSRRAKPQPAKIQKTDTETVITETAISVPAQDQQPEPVSDQALVEIPEEEFFEPEAKEIYLNFENTDLSGFINYIADLRNINLVPSEMTSGVKISLTIREPLTVDEAWNVFLSVLEMSGFCMVERNVNGKKLFSVVQKENKYTEPLPVFIGTPSEQLPDSDETIRFVTFLTNLPVSDPQLDQLISSMLTPGCRMDRHDTLNCLIIVDKCYNIKSAMKVVNELDNSGYQETVSVMRLKRASANDVKQMLEQIIKKPEQSPLSRLLGYNAEGTADYFAPSTKIVAEERTNSLILLGSQKSIKKIEDFVAEYIDQEIKKPTSPIHVYELQFSDAEQVKAILDEVTQTRQSSAGKFGGTRGGVKYFNSIAIEADTQGNRLLVSCADKQDWPLLRQTIEDIDKPQPQVAIETLVVQVDENHIKQLGGQFHNPEHGSPIPGVDVQHAGLTNLQFEKSGTDIVSLLGNLIGGIASSGLEIGTTALTLSRAGSVWAAFTALKTETNASLLDKSFVTVSNRTKSSIQVGETRRVAREEAYTGSDNSFVSGYESLPASTTIEYEPQINPDGIINLKVNIDLSTFTSDKGDQSEKKLSTHVSVANGQVLVLGGFVKTKVTEAKNKKPIFGDIPLLGWLAKKKNRTEIKSYIFLFVSPTIVKPRLSPGAGLYTKMKINEATKDVDQSVETQVSRDPIHNWFFNPDRDDYAHKVVDFANARYQPTTVDLRNDPYYRPDSLTLELGGEESVVTAQKELEQPDMLQPAVQTISMAPQDITSQRATLKSLVRGQDQPRAQTKTEAQAPKGKFKSFIATHQSEEEQRDQEKHVDKSRTEFKQFITSKSETTKRKPDLDSDRGRTALKQLVASKPITNPFAKNSGGDV